MQSENDIAFKEWAVVTAALLQGRQTVILRKGGIAEQGGVFRPEYREFWLFPTQFHQQAGALDASAGALLQAATDMQPPHGQVHLTGYAVVEDVVFIEQEQTLPLLTGLHVLSERTVSERFHYRRPGLHLLIVRISQLSSPHLLSDTPHFAGCRTWVELPAALSTADLRPVLDDAQFLASRAEIIRRLNPGRVC